MRSSSSRPANPNTVFAAAGDLIGASTFESFIQNDKPTIDALNEAGLEVSAAGNHEFDAGLRRPGQPGDGAVRRRRPTRGGADWQYIAANVRNDRRDAQSHAAPRAPGSRTSAASQVGFVGAVTEDLPALVSPAGIADIEVTDIVARSTRAPTQLKADGRRRRRAAGPRGCAPTTSCASATDPTTAFGQIVNGVDTNIDAIVSGHTHLAYNHSSRSRPGDEGRAVTERPVVSAGQYGTNLNQLVFTVDDTDRRRRHAARPTSTPDRRVRPTPFAPNYPADPAATTIVDDAMAKADVLGAVELGKIAGPFNRAKLANGTDREPRRRVHPRQPRRRGPALGDRAAGVRCGADRLHEPRRTARRTWSATRQRATRATLTYKQAAVSSRSPTRWST